MSAHPSADRLQDLLEGVLSAADERSLHAHLEGCPRCAANLRRYERVFALLAEPAFTAPSPALTERILDHVLPSRVRVRWARTVGLGYAATLAVVLSAAVAWSTQPGARAFAGWLTGEASERMVQALKLVIQGAAFLAVGLSSGWGLLASVVERFAPLGRALASVAGNPTVGIALWLAGLSCLALLWWLRPRAGGAGKGIRHVGLLGV